jgi:hypothetical protein
MMKKTFLLILTGLTVCLLLPAMAQSANLLVNGGFESWAVNGAGGPPDSFYNYTAGITCPQATSPVNSGSYSAYISANAVTGTKTVRLTTPIAVNPNEIFACTLMVYDSVTYGRGRLWFYWTGGSHNANNPYSINLAGWQQMVVWDTVPAGATSLQLDFRSYDSASVVCGNIYYDDFRLWKVIPATNQPPVIGAVNRVPTSNLPGIVFDIRAAITDDYPILLGTDSLAYRVKPNPFTRVYRDSIAFAGNPHWYHMGPFNMLDTIEYYVWAIDDSNATNQSSTYSFVIPDTAFCGIDSIYNVEFTLYQGSGDSCFNSPKMGQVVNICGIVTAAEWNPSYRYTYLQDPRSPIPGDASWTGIEIYDFVDAGGNTLIANIGDKLEVTGRVGEYYGWTNIDSLGSFSIRSSGNPVPDTTKLYVSDLAGGCGFSSEPFENLLVRFDTVTVVAGDPITGKWWIKDSHSPTTDSIRMFNYIWVGGPNPPSPEPSLGARYKSVVGVLQYEGRAASTKGFILQPRMGSDYDPLVIPQANITAAWPVDPTHLAVLFDRSMQQASAENWSHYSTVKGLTFTGAVLDSTHKKVTLVSSAQTNGLADTVIVVGVIDSAFGNPMTNPDSVRFWQGYTPISLVQTPGPSGDSSAICRDVVTIKGVIVADTTSTLYNNLIINDQSDSIRFGCVMAPLYRSTFGFLPVIGDTLVVTGSVIEYYFETELSYFSTYMNVRLINHGSEPQPRHRTTDASEFRYRGTASQNERLEDVLVKLCDSLVVLPAGLPLPGDSAQLLRSLTTGDTICLITKVNYHHYTDPVPGTIINGITGIFRWHFNFWRLEPRFDADFNTGYYCGPPSDINGYVKKQDNITPIAGVVVKTYLPGPVLYATDTTDANGHYNLWAVPETYSETFQKTGYADTSLAAIVVAGGATTNITMLMTESALCEYLIGDFNGDHLRGGGDVTYGVRFFKLIGTPPKDSCWMDSTSKWFYVAGDVNGNCEVRGSDITRLVAYFKIQAGLNCCHWFPTTLPPFPPIRVIPPAIQQDNKAIIRDLRTTE